MVTSSPSNPHPTSLSAQSLHSQVHDAASVARDCLRDVVSNIQEPEMRNGLMNGWDTLVKVEGHVRPVREQSWRHAQGGPREVATIRSRTGYNTSRGRGRGRASGDNTVPSWGASVPFVVSASQDNMSAFGSQQTQDWDESIRIPTQQLNPLPQQHAQMPREEQNACLHAKLSQLGAQYQLAALDEMYH